MIKKYKLMSSPGAKAAILIDDNKDSDTGWKVTLLSYNKPIIECNGNWYKYLSDVPTSATARHVCKFFREFMCVNYYTPKNRPTWEMPLSNKDKTAFYRQVSRYVCDGEEIDDD